MATEVLLPKLGMNMESARIISWRKHEGDEVAVGDVLAEVETDKAIIDLEAEESGILHRILAEEGDQIAVNEAVAVIGVAGEDVTGFVEHLKRRPVAVASHVEQIYQSWHQAPNGQPATPVIDAPPAGSNGKLDAEAIRARLERRGVLPGAPDTESATPVTRIAIYGCGLGAKQLLEVARHLDDVEVAGLIDDNPDLAGTTLGGVRVLGGFDALADLVAKREVDGVALSFHSEVRKKVHQRLKAEMDVRIVPLVDPRAMIGMDVTIEEGALVEAGAVIGPGTVVGEGVIVDVGAVVAHDCYLGAFSHLSPGCSLSGVVHLKENVLVGVGASLNSTITVGSGVIITPGSAVVNDVADDQVVSGVPARVIGDSRRNG